MSERIIDRSALLRQTLQVEGCTRARLSIPKLAVATWLEYIGELNIGATDSGRCQGPRTAIPDGEAAVAVDKSTAIASGDEVSSW